MQRFVLRYRGPGRAPEADVRRVRTSALNVIDESPRLLLVEGERTTVRELIDDLRDWVSSDESTVQLPDTRFRTSGS
jgi:hypothetical protein